MEAAAKIVGLAVKLKQDHDKVIPRDAKLLLEFHGIGQKILMTWVS
jgi:endonuclease III